MSPEVTSQFFKQPRIVFVCFLCSLSVISLFCEEYQVTELRSAAIHFLVCSVLLPYSSLIHYTLVPTVVTRRQHQHSSRLDSKHVEGNEATC
jgi:hypothetical protein